MQSSLSNKIGTQQLHGPRMVMVSHGWWVPGRPRVHGVSHAAVLHRQVSRKNFLLVIPVVSLEPVRV